MMVPTRQRKVEQVVFGVGSAIGFLCSAATFLTGFGEAFKLFQSSSAVESSYASMSMVVALGIFLVSSGAVFLAALSKGKVALTLAIIGGFFIALQGPWSWPHPDGESILTGPVSTNPWNPATDPSILTSALPGVVLLFAVVAASLLKFVQSRQAHPTIKGPLAAVSSVVLLTMILGFAVDGGDVFKETPTGDAIVQEQAAQLADGALFPGRSTGEATVVYPLGITGNARNPLVMEDLAAALEEIYASADINLDVTKRTVEGGSITVDTSQGRRNDANIVVKFNNATLPSRTQNSSWFVQDRTTFQAILPFAADRLAPTGTTSKAYNLAAPSGDGDLGTIHLPAMDQGEVVAHWEGETWAVLDTQNDGRTATAQVAKPGVYTTILLGPGGSRTLDPRIDGAGSDVATVLVPGGQISIGDYSTFDVEASSASWEVSLTDSTGTVHPLEYLDLNNGTIHAVVPQNAALGVGSLRIITTDNLGGRGESTWPTNIVNALPPADMNVQIRQVGNDLEITWTSNLQPPAWEIHGQTYVDGQTMETFGCPRNLPGNTRKVVTSIIGLGGRAGDVGEIEIELSATYPGLVDTKGRLTYHAYAGTSVTTKTPVVFVGGNNVKRCS